VVIYGQVGIATTLEMVYDGQFYTFVFSCIQLMISAKIKAEDYQMEEQLRKCKDSFVTSWEAVNRIAHQALRDARSAKPSPLPNQADVEDLAAFLKEQIRTLLEVGTSISQFPVLGDGCIELM
jgi:hypothetical protein